MKTVKRLILGKPKPKDVAIDFMTMCYEGCKEDELDELFQRAVNKGRRLEIKECKDFDGNRPWHKGSKHSNHIALNWII